MDLLNLRAKISLDRSEYDSGIEGVKSAAKAAGKVLAGAFGLASAAVVAFTKGAVSSFGDYEQLAGGIETLYKDSAGKMLQYADEAFKSAGLSANEYMETAIESSAALINNLAGDTEKAADLMNMSIVDMADNVNKMGTSMESIQNAYRGFSRGNFTMLDNLALGFSGTADGMQQLLDKAEKLSGIKYDIKNYADIVKAIHVVQTEMGISGMTYQEAAEAVRKGEMTWEEATQKLGTTAKEAMTTLQGSFKAAKSAWQNVLIALGKGEGVKEAVSRLSDSIFVWVKNLMPVIKNALSGIGTLVKELAPIISKEIPGLVESVLPDLLSSAASLLGSLASAMPDLLVAVWNAIKTSLGTFVNSLGTQFPALGNIFDKVRDGASVVFSSVKVLWDKKGKPAMDAVRDAWQRIKNAVQPVIDKIKDLKDRFSEYVSSGELVEDITNKAHGAITFLSNAIKVVADKVASAVEKGREFVDWLNSGTAGAKALKTIIVGITAAFVAYKAVMIAITVAQKAWAVITGLVSAAQQFLNLVLSMNPIGIVIAAIAALVAAFIYLWNNSESFRNFWINLWENIKTITTNVVNKIKTAIPAAWDKIKSATAKKWEEIKSSILNKWDAIKTNIAAKIDLIKATVSAKWESVKATVTSKVEGIKTKAVEIFNKMKEPISKAIDKVKEVFDFEWSLPHIKLPHFRVIGGEPPYGWMGQGSLPTIKVDWYKKAYGNPYLFTKPTVMMRGFGDGNGGEIVYGHENLMNDIRKAVGAGTTNVTINVYPSADMDETKLAKKIERIIVNEQKKRGAVYA